MNKELVVFIDCGDTLVDESTQIFDDEGVVLRADLIPGARDMLMTLHEEGYRMALVADGGTKSFHNILKQHGIEHVFETLAISQEVKADKPNSLIFQSAMEHMNLHQSDKVRIVMIGNNLERDIVGANRMDICSILISFSPRYRMQPASMQEIPDYVVAMPREIPGLLYQLDLQVKNRKVLQVSVCKKCTELLE